MQVRARIPNSEGGVEGGAQPNEDVIQPGVVKCGLMLKGCLGQMWSKYEVVNNHL
jgi:hypothetical protein